MSIPSKTITIKSINEYQTEAHTFSKHGNGVVYPLLGLAEECGEVCGKVAKFIRKHSGRLPVNAMLADEDDFKELRVDLLFELGDVAWMVAEIATMFDIALEDVLQTNIDKLADRNVRGVIVGEGDHR